MGKKKLKKKKDSTEESSVKGFHSDTKYDIIVNYSFYVYVSAAGKNVIQKEIDEYDDYGVVNFQRSVIQLSVTPRSEWYDSNIEKLKGFDKLYEIKYKNDNKQTRAIGFFDGCKFIILGICTHKGRVYDPPGIFESCEKRREKIIQGCASIVRLKIDGENYPPDDQ